MNKPNWVCSNCSMWSSRKSSVKRHIGSHRLIATIYRYPQFADSTDLLNTSQVPKILPIHTISEP